MSAVDSSLSEPLQPVFPPPPGLQASASTEKAAVQSIINALQMQSHVEGGYFAETDRDPRTVHNPFTPHADNDATRNASTTIFYLITEKSPMGAFHRNKARTVHTLHQGRGRYVLIHADEAEGQGEGTKARVETFVVGHDVAKGERLQWIVEGGKYKCSFLLPDEEGGRSSDGLLISETVVPGFEFADHDFLPEKRFGELLTEAQAKEMQWMVRKS